MLRSLLNNKLNQFVLLFYSILVIWWTKIYLSGVRETQENYLFGFVYALIALIGGINGLIISKKWGGFKSSVGRALIFLSLGLLGEWFGQTVWSYYNVIEKIEVPYPSLADIGYFSIIPLYALGVLSLGKAIGAHFKLKTMWGKLIVIIIPIIMVTLSFYLFLKNLWPDFSNPIRTFLDFGYPLGEAITISITLVIYELSRGVLGGKMKNKILLLIVALFAQYITDFTFLYKAGEGTYYNAGVVDLMYVTAFLITTLALSGFKNYD